jgi:polysaccharide biosynthesis/export protein
MFAMRQSMSRVLILTTIVLVGALPYQADGLRVMAADAAQSPARNAFEKQSLIVTSNYYIGPEDVLEVTVWRNKDLSKSVTVRPDGRISLPLVGDIKASGLTPTELTAQITEQLTKFMEGPVVSVILNEVNSYSIYIVGQVAKPGRYFLKSKTTLLQAITLAGGFAPNAERNQLIILRWDGPVSEIKLKANYTNIVLKDTGTENVILKPGDTIVVPSETMVLTN